MLTKCKILKSDFFKYILIIMFMWIPDALFASTNSGSFPIHSIGSLSFDVDVCQLDGPGDSSIVEIIYSVFLTKEKALQSKSESMTSLSIDLSISNKSGQVIGSVIDSKSVSLYDSLNQSKFTTFLDIKRFTLAPDTVLLDLKIQESRLGTQGRITEAFKIRGFENTFSLSDMYFVSHVQRGDGTSIFEKGGVMLVPNPSRLYYNNGDNPKVFVYYEINNLSYDRNSLSYYETKSEVYDIAGNEVLKYPAKQFKVASENVSRIKVLPINEFKSGIYSLSLEVLDIETGFMREIRGYFKVDGGDINDTTILPMSDVEEKRYLNQIKYIATDLEIETFEKLNARGKQEFLLNFWKSKDPDPKTSENEFMVEHFRRLGFAEKNFKGGTASDMGRVYIMYGSPVDIVRQSSTVSSAQAVEIWSYAIDGRTDFVFVDRDGDGKFVLIHSTHRDEYYNPEWENKLK